MAIVTISGATNNVPGARPFYTHFALTAGLLNIMLGCQNVLAPTESPGGQAVWSLVLSAAVWPLRL